MKVLADEEIGLLRCAQHAQQNERDRGVDIPAEGERGAYLRDAFVGLMFAGFLRFRDDQKGSILTPEGEDALYAATRNKEER